MSLYVHPSARVDPLSSIETSTRGSLITIGEGSFIDSFVKFKAAGGSGNITIGRNVYINSGCVLYVGNGISIGDNVSIAANCVLAPTNHQISDGDLPHQNQGFMASRGGIRIEEDVWIGALTVLLDGAVCSRGSVVGAGSVVREKLESYGIYVGNPLRLVGHRNRALHQNRPDSSAVGSSDSSSEQSLSSPSNETAR